MQDFVEAQAEFNDHEGRKHVTIICGSILFNYYLSLLDLIPDVHPSPAVYPRNRYR